MPPELPEVEVTRRSLEPHLLSRRVARAIIRHHGLRWGITPGLGAKVEGQTIRGIARRGKYLLLDCGSGWLILHLGMSGSLRLLPASTPPEKHDHFDLVLDDGNCMRLRDPRRFGTVIWTEADPRSHPLLAKLGIEPLGREFSAAWLYRQTRTRKASIKQTLMASHLIAGVGNIYANEALFRAGINPRTPAARIGIRRFEKLVAAIKETLKLAIRAGGSSLRDFVAADGAAGYFQQHYLVYGRAGLPCKRCGTKVRQIRQGQRSTFYCPRCQT